jgi:hypothetical protein
MQAVRWMVAEEESCMRGVFFQAALLSLSLFFWLGGEGACGACGACLLHGKSGPPSLICMYICMYLDTYILYCFKRGV